MATSMCSSRPASSKACDDVIKALIFDMDGTMIDSMGYHRLSWIEFARRHSIEIEVDDLMRRTTGRTGAECMNELFGREFSQAESWALIDEKERIYRELFAPVFRDRDELAKAAHLIRSLGYGRRYDELADAEAAFGKE